MIRVNPRLELENLRLKEENIRLLQLSPKTIGFAPHHDKTDKVIPPNLMLNPYQLSEEDSLGGSILQDNQILLRSNNSDTRDQVDIYNSRHDVLKEKVIIPLPS
jgi:hypothetical protein